LVLNGTELRIYVRGSSVKTGKQRLVTLVAMCMGVAPCCLSQQATVSPPKLTFAPQVVNLVAAASSPQTVMVTNTGTADLMISSIEASGGYAQTNECSVLSPGSTCTIQVSFSPGTLGSIEGAITINDNSPLSPQVVSLSGRGIPPATLTPSVIEFGTVAVGTTSTPRQVTLTVPPNLTVFVTGISTSGDYAQTNNCPSQLKNGQSCSISVVFKPTNNVSVLGALAVSTRVETFDFGFSAALSGIGSGTVVSQVSLSPSILNFGNKGLDGEGRTRTVTLTNTSTDKSLTIQTVSLAGSPNPPGAFPMYAIKSSTCSGMLSPGAQCHIQITFSTTFSELFPEQYPAAVTIVDSDPTSPQVVGISGRQTEELTFNPVSLTFPPTTVGQTSDINVVTTDVDDESGILHSVTASGDFSQTGFTKSCVATRGTTCNVKVSFTPTQTGEIAGSLTINAYPECSPRPPFTCWAPIILNLRGTGK